MYSDSLQGEVKQLSRVQLVEFEDYFEMRMENLPTSVKWDFLKHNIISTEGQTLWQFTEAYFNSDERPVGMIQPPLGLIEYILSNQK